MQPTNHQIGGSHYQSEYQPVELFAKLSLNAFQANVIKYVFRHKAKNGKEDLEKARHYCDMATQFNLAKRVPVNIIREIDYEVNKFAEANKLDSAQFKIIYMICRCKYPEASGAIMVYQDNSYGEQRGSTKFNQF